MLDILRCHFEVLVSSKSRIQIEKNMARVTIIWRRDEREFTGLMIELELIVPRETLRYTEKPNILLSHSF